VTVLIGHPTGNPNSHHAALAHFEAGWLEAFCVPWVPSEIALRMLAALPGVGGGAARLARRRFAPLAGAPTIQGRWGEWGRLSRRALGVGDEGLSYEANDWLMRTMARHCRWPSVTAVHAYEDCALQQFEVARRLGKACIYDLPIGFFPAWRKLQEELARRYVDWLPTGGLPESRHVRPDQKRGEMDLADLVLAPSSFVEKTIREHLPEKRVARAAYGVDLDFWRPATVRAAGRPLTFLYAGQISLRKGIPLLLRAWEKAAIAGARLELIGAWQLAGARRGDLASGVEILPPCSREELRRRYQAADVFVFPSNFEGFGLVLLEALACGLPAIASDATAGPDVLTEACGRVVPRDELDPLVEALRGFAAERDRLDLMATAARSQAERWTWEDYRRSVARAVAPFV